MWRSSQLAEARAIVADRMALSVIRVFWPETPARRTRAAVSAWMEALTRTCRVRGRLDARPAGKTVLSVGQRFRISDEHLRRNLPRRCSRRAMVVFGTSPRYTLGTRSTGTEPGAETGPRFGGHSGCCIRHRSGTYLYRSSRPGRSPVAAANAAPRSASPLGCRLRGKKNNRFDPLQIRPPSVAAASR